MPPRGKLVAKDRKAPRSGGVPPKPRARNTGLATLIKDGKVPLARRAFALFLADTVRKEAMSMSAVASRWKDLPAEERALWQAKSAKEYELQRRAAATLGIIYGSDSATRTGRQRMYGRSSASGAPLASAPAVMVQQVVVKIEGPAGAQQAPPPKCHKGKAVLERPSEIVVPQEMPRAPRASSEMVHPLSLGRFRVLSQVRLGHGSYGSVLLVRDVDGRRFAAKVFYGTGDGRLELMAYQKLAKADPHPAFLDIIDSCVTDPMSWIVLPYIEGSLTGMIKRQGPLDTIVVDAVLRQARGGLVHMHDKAGLLHLDMKPENLLWNNSSRHLFLADFSLCEPWPIPAGHDPLQEYCTAPYRPPELFYIGVPMCGGASGANAMRKLLRPAVDAWGLGCIIWEACVGKRLFAPCAGEKESELVRGFVKRTWPTQGWNREIPWNVRSATHLLLHPDAVFRERALQQSAST